MQWCKYVPKENTGYSLGINFATLSVLKLHPLLSEDNFCMMETFWCELNFETCSIGTVNLKYFMEKAFYLLARYEITNICVYEGSKYCGYYGGLSCKFLILPTLLFKLNKHFWCLHVYYSCNMSYKLRSYFLNIFLYT